MSERVGFESVKMNKREESTSLNGLLTKINDYRVKIENGIEAELNRHEDSKLYVPIKTAMKRGKRLRPVLLVLSYESVGGQDLDPFPIAVAVELMHLESLIHDDILDRDELRRATAAFHVVYGYDVALLSADFILSMILDITSRYTDQRLGKVLAVAASRMCEGQIEELMTCKENQELNLQEYEKIVYNKTASLFEASTTIGAIIGGAGEIQVTALAEYGRLLGIAYQICDDFADLETRQMNNLLTLLKEKERIRIMSTSCIHEAKKSLETLKESKAKKLLIEIVDSATLS